MLQPLNEIFIWKLKSLVNVMIWIIEKEHIFLASCQVISLLKKRNYLIWIRYCDKIRISVHVIKTKKFYDSKIKPI